VLFCRSQFLLPIFIFLANVLVFLRLGYVKLLRIFCYLASFKANFLLNDEACPFPMSLCLMFEILNDRLVYLLHMEVVIFVRLAAE